MAAASDCFLCSIPTYAIPADPVDEIHRMTILKECHLLDSKENEPDYDRLTALARRIFNIPICLISLVDTNRQYFKSNLGLAARETPRQISFCAHAILQEFDEQLIVLDTYLDSRFRENPLVTGYPFIRFYAGTVIVIEGCKIGTLCLIDTVPHESFSLEDKLNLLDLTAAVSNLISKRRELYLHEATIQKEKVLDLMQTINTPLTSLACGLSLLGNDNRIPISLDQLPEVIHGLNANMMELQHCVQRGLSTISESIEATMISTDDLKPKPMPPSNNNYHNHDKKTHFDSLRSFDETVVSDSLKSSDSFIGTTFGTSFTDDLPLQKVLVVMLLVITNIS